MEHNLHAECVPVLVRFLSNLRNILDKARHHAQEHRLEESALLSARLFPDMFPMARQVQIACDSAKGAAARLAAIEVPRHPDVESTFEALIDRIDLTMMFIRDISPTAFDGSGARPIVLQFGDWRREFATGAEFLRTWALPNFYFHISTAYGLLRHNGVALGKMDYLG